MILDQNLFTRGPMSQTNFRVAWAVVVAQLVERSLPTPEVRGSNPVIGKLLHWTFNCLPSVNCVLKRRK